LWGQRVRGFVQERGDLGRRVRGCLDAGAYVPDDVTVAMVREWLRKIPRSTRVVFDGFPRTVAQAEALDRLLAEFGRRVGGVVLLDAPHDELFARLSGRAKAQRRTAATPEDIANRLDAYEQTTRTVVAQPQRHRT